MTELYVFSNGTDQPQVGGDNSESVHNESVESFYGGGVSVSKWFQKTSNVLNDSETYSFFDHLAIPIGLHCFIEPSNYEDANKEEDEDVIKNNIYDRLFYLSAKQLGSKKRTTRKKIAK